MLIRFRSAATGQLVAADYTPEIASKRLKALRHISHLPEEQRQNAEAEIRAIQTAFASVPDPLTQVA